MQAGAERALNRLMTALAGASVLFGQGMLETGLTFDIPTLLVDDEIIDYVLRMLAGFKVDATTLSTDLIKEVGPFGTYLAEMNTFEHLGDLSTYNLMNRRNYDMWAASGKPDLYGQALRRGFGSPPESERYPARFPFLLLGKTRRGTKRPFFVPTLYAEKTTPCRRICSRAQRDELFHGKPRHTRQGAPCHDHDIKRTLRRDAESQDA